MEAALFSKSALCASSERRTQPLKTGTNGTYLQDICYLACSIIDQFRWRHGENDVLDHAIWSANGIAETRQGAAVLGVAGSDAQNSKTVNVSLAEGLV